MPLIHELITNVADRAPDAVAVVEGDRRLTFAELEAMSTPAAASLRSRGVGRGDRVAVNMRRRAELLAVVLGVLKAGAAFVPSDIRTPERRLRLIAQDCAARVVVTEADRVADFACLIEPSRVVVADDLLCPPTLTAKRAQGLAGADLAYVLYTSGTTGRPKGVAVSHDGLARYLTWAADFYGMSAGTGAPLFTSVGFDLTLTSLFGPLTVARAVTVLPETDELPVLADLLRGRPDFSFIKVTPHHLDLLSELLDGVVEGAVRCVIVGGDALWSDSVRSWRERAPGSVVVNEYGPTETIVGCAVYQVPTDGVAEAGARVPIGGPAAGAIIHLLDACLRPVQCGEAGELYVGGPGAGGWYLLRPGLTAERFLPDPFGSPGDRMYRTGDRARQTAEGELEYLGRADGQVKVHGYRVEPAEVQGVLRSYPGVENAVVLTRVGTRGVELVAVAVGNVESTLLRGWLAEQLPDWMVPPRIVIADALPLTVNGKVDRGAVLALVADTVDAAHDADRPRNAVEEVLVGLIAKVLHLESVGPDENFFGLGGDSIRGIQLVARARKVGLRFTARDVVDSPTAAGLAEVALRTSAPPNTSAGTGPVPLTAIQRWFFELDLPAPDHWNQALLLDLPSGTDPVSMQRTVQHVTADHDVLRMQYELTAEGWTQRLEPGPARVVFDVVERTSASSDDRTARAAHAGLDLRDGPLMRVVLLRGESDQADRLLLVAHHLVMDTVSWQLIVDDLAQAYDQIRLGRPPAPLPPSGHYTAWARACAAVATRRDVARRATHWRRSMPSSITSVPRDDPTAGNDLAGRVQLTLTLPPDQVESFAAALDGHDLRPHEVLLGAFVAAVCDVLATPPPLIDVEGHGREEIGQEVDVSRTIGWFTALYPVHLGADADPVALVRAAREAIRAAPLSGLGYGLARYLTRTPELADDPQPELLFNYLGRSEAVVSEALGWRLSDEPSGPPTGSTGARPYLLEYHPAIVSGGLRSTFVYHRACHKKPTVELIGQRLHELLCRPRDLLPSPVSLRYGDAGLGDDDLDRVLARYSRRPS